MSGAVATGRTEPEPLVGGRRELQPCHALLPFGALPPPEKKGSTTNVMASL